jgi:putative N6-adenine-specific DNA methylase
MLLESPDKFENPDFIFTMVARTLKNFEPIVERELLGIGARSIKLEKRAVIFQGTLKTLYRANYELRSVISILIPIVEFPAFNEDELYSNSKKVEWEKWITKDYTFAISADVSSRTITHSQYAALKVKDAIVDRFREKTGDRPSVNLELPDIRIRLLIGNNKGTIYIDTSGDALSYRGYRTQAGDAPLSEVLAAGLILMSEYTGKQVFVDPMCGSGTLPIEAACIAANLPAGYVREDYGFFRLPHFNRKIWDSVRNNALKNIRFNQIKTITIATGSGPHSAALNAEKENTMSDRYDSQDRELKISSIADFLPHPLERPILDAPVIIGSDSDHRMTTVAKLNAKRAGVENLIQFQCEDFFDMVPPEVTEEGQGIGLCNPPYGERMIMQEPETFYDIMGDRLKNFWNNYNFWVITSDREALKKMRLRADNKTDVMNAAIECRFQRYQIYKGSKENKENGEDSE